MQRHSEQNVNHYSNSVQQARRFIIGRLTLIHTKTHTYTHQNTHTYTHSLTDGFGSTVIHVFKVLNFSRSCVCVCVCVHRCVCVCVCVCVCLCV